MKEIESLRLGYRELNIEDSQLIVDWRNSSRLRKVSRKKQKFTLENHKKWFIKTRSTRSDFIFFEKNTRKSIGMISLENKKYNILSENSYELSKFIGNPNFSGKGFALEATSTVLDHFKKNNNVEFFYAVTRKDNYSNIKLNQKVGFVIEEFPDCIEYNPKSWVYMKMKIK